MGSNKDLPTLLDRIEEFQRLRRIWIFSRRRRTSSANTGCRPVPTRSVSPNSMRSGQVFLFRGHCSSPRKWL
jgi:hypothetical protein